MKKVIKLLSTLVIVACIGYIIYLNFFGIRAELKNTAEDFYAYIEQQEVSFSKVRVVGGSEDKSIFEYKYSDGTLKELSNGNIKSEYNKGETNFDLDFDEILYTASLAISALDLSLDVTIVEDIEVDIPGYDLSGEWYYLEIKGSCKRDLNCLADELGGGNIESLRYIKIDGTGYIDVDGYGITAILIDQ